MSLTVPWTPRETDQITLLADDRDEVDREIEHLVHRAHQLIADLRSNLWDMRRR